MGVTFLTSQLHTHIYTHSVLTITELMDMLFKAGKVTSSEVEQVQQYISTNSDPVVRNTTVEPL